MAVFALLSTRNESNNAFSLHTSSHTDSTATMFTLSSFAVVAFATSALACPQIQKRQTVSSLTPANGSSSTQRIWAYEASYNWGRLSPGMYIVSLF